MGRVICTAVLLEHMPGVSRIASMAQQMDGAQRRTLRADLFHPGVGLLVLLAITVLNIYKPAGMTPYGRRKQREQRLAARRSQVNQEIFVGATEVAASHNRSRV